MPTQVTTPPPDAPVAQPYAVTFERVAALLLRFEALREGSGVTLRPIADLTPCADGSGDVMCWATVFIDAGDGAGPAPYALHEVRLAADCLALDCPFLALPDLGARLRDAADAAGRACLTLQRSLD